PRIQFIRARPADTKCRTRGARVGASAYRVTDRDARDQLPAAMDRNPAAAKRRPTEGPDRPKAAGATQFPAPAADSLSSRVPFLIRPSWRSRTIYLRHVEPGNGRLSCFPSPGALAQSARSTQAQGHFQAA